MKLVIYLTVYTLMNAYLFIKLLRWLSNLSEKTNKLPVKIIVGCIYGIGYLSVIVGYLLPISTAQKNIQIFANMFTGCVIYAGLVAIVLEIIRVISTKCFKVQREAFNSKKYLYTSCAIVIVITLFANIYGNYNAQQIKVKNYDVNINKTVKDVNNLKIGLLADFHLGYSIGYKMMEQMVEKLNKENVDIVFIAGDIFDNSVNTVDDISKCQKALASIKSKYGVYATFGNHDIDERLFEGFSIQSDHAGFRDKKMETVLIDAGIKILDDQKFTMINDSINIIGRKDSERTGFGEEERESIESLLQGVDMSKPTIVVEHEPRKLPEMSDLGIDLHLAGHTHAGQIFPFNIGAGFMWKNLFGQKQFGNMTSVVTPGIGIYGPFLRVGTDSEISIVNVHFK